MPLRALGLKSGVLKLFIGKDEAHGGATGTAVSIGNGYFLTNAHNMTKALNQLGKSRSGYFDKSPLSCDGYYLFREIK